MEIISYIIWVTASMFIKWYQVQHEEWMARRNNARKNSEIVSLLAEESTIDLDDETIYEHMLKL